MPKDLTGQRFGRLLVLKLVPEPYISPQGKPTRRWLCRCDCGNEIVVLQNALTSKNGTRSCGCTKKEITRSRAKDMTGQRFGRLIVLGPAELEIPKPNGTKLGWLCHCDCGKEIVVPRKELICGLKSCGCLLSDTAKGKIKTNTLGQYNGTTISAIKPDRKANKNSKSGIKGVYWSKAESRWIAKIGFQGKNITLGRFVKIEDAIAARKAAEEKYFNPILEKYDRNHS